MDERRVLCVGPEGVGGALDGREGVEPVVRETVAGARDALSGTAVDCVVSEYDLPDGTGFDVFAAARAALPDVGCVLYTTADRRAVGTERAPSTVVEYVDRSGEHAPARLAAVVEAMVRGGTQADYPLPEREAERLDALAEYVPDPDATRERVETVTTLAARALDVERASLNLLHEHRQEFLACHGADWTETARADSICTFAILDAGVTVIEDVAADPRFEGVETLADLEIAAYMGAPLRVGAGDAIGTLCVYHDEPRRFDEDDRETLRLLASLTVELLELQRRAGGERDE